MLWYGMSKWHRRARTFTLRFTAVFSVLAFFVVAGLVAALLTFSSMFPAGNPLNLTPLLPRLDGYLAGFGLRVDASRMETYYDNGSIVLRGEDIKVYGQNDELAVMVEKGAVELSRRRLFFGIPAPKLLAAEGVTMRLVRTSDTVQLAGLPVVQEEGRESETNIGGIVEWLNGLKAGLRWGMLERAEADRVTLLLRDDIQQAEWAMEGGDFKFERGYAGDAGDGERAVMNANLRRLYGFGQRPLSTPVVVTFEHVANAPDAVLRARFERSDIDMVADYFPLELKDMFQAKGQVEVGLNLREGNKLGQPWVTLRLTDVTVTPPMGFTKPMNFRTFLVTASYMPSPTDVLVVNGIRAVDTRGMEFRARGRIQGVTTDDPAMEVTLYVPRGEAQRLFDYFPDQSDGFDKALEWLRPNIRDAHFSNLVVHYLGRPSAFPHCENECGLSITARIDEGKVRYLPEMPLATVQASGTFALVGESIHVEIPRAQTANQKGRNVKVDLTELFSPKIIPTGVIVSVDLEGPLDEVITNVSKLEKPLPLAATGQHTSKFALNLPLIDGKETEITDADISVTTAIRNLAVTRLDDLPDTRLSAPEATYTMTGPIARLQAPAAQVNGLPMAVTWQDNWKDKGTQAMQLTARGQVNGAWLAANGMPEAVTVDGPVGVNLALNQNGAQMGLQLTADAQTARVGFTPLEWSKPAGQPLALTVSGTMERAGGQFSRLTLPALSLVGTNVEVKGNVDWRDGNLAASRLNLRPFRLGDNNANVTLENGTLRLFGTRLDLRGIDLSAANDGNETPDGKLEVDIAEMLFKGGTLSNAKANLESTNNVLDINSFTATHSGGDAVQITESALPGQAGRRKQSIRVENLGGLLRTLDLYHALLGGRLEGEITYDAPNSGGGVLSLRDYELDNPPTLVRLLSMLSLEQLFAGTHKLIFTKAIIPVRMVGDDVAFDGMKMEGPAMSLRFDGVYNRRLSELSIDGRMAPAIPFNRLVARIPIIGNILAGSQDGVVVADFKLKGPTSDPKIEVRPLSVLTPGLIKDIFR